MLLLEYLEREYNKYLAAVSLPPVPSVKDFVKWSAQYLIDNPPSGITPAGITLANGVTLEVVSGGSMPLDYSSVNLFGVPSAPRGDAMSNDAGHTVNLFDSGL
jgi:hypothetical protein